MTYPELRHAVWHANMEISRTGLAMLTWGNASGVDRDAEIVIIKPSGVDYATLTPEQLVVVDLASGKVVEGKLRPSSDTPTHLELYRQFPAAGGVVHTHSHFATVWAQAGQEIPCYGTTHADTFYGSIPLTRQLTPEEVTSDYELNTGRVIVERFTTGKLYPAHVPGVLVAGHAPFAWGPSPAKALENALVLEEVARMAFHTRALNPTAPLLPPYVLGKHFLRKHGATAYYGQK